jgi:hypothetical protein
MWTKEYLRGKCLDGTFLERIKTEYWREGEQNEILERRTTEYGTGGEWQKGWQCRD